MSDLGALVMKTFRRAPPSAEGQAIPVRDWINVGAAGQPAKFLGFDDERSDFGNRLSIGQRR